MLASCPYLTNGSTRALDGGEVAELQERSALAGPKMKAVLRLWAGCPVESHRMSQVHLGGCGPALVERQGLLLRLVASGTSRIRRTINNHQRYAAKQPVNGARASAFHGTGSSTTTFNEEAGTMAHSRSSFDLDRKSAAGIGAVLAHAPATTTFNEEAGTMAHSRSSFDLDRKSAAGIGAVLAHAPVCNTCGECGNKMTSGKHKEQQLPFAWLNGVLLLQKSAQVFVDGQQRLSSSMCYRIPILTLSKGRLSTIEPQVKAHEVMVDMLTMSCQLGAGMDLLSSSTGWARSCCHDGLVTHTDKTSSQKPASEFICWLYIQLSFV
nr:hypothetical protein CFP56_12069 [Quercus suber]